MTSFSPTAPSSSDLIERPPCSKCGAQTMLARIEPDIRDHDLRTFECRECSNIDTVVVKFR